MAKLRRTNDATFAVYHSKIKKKRNTFFLFLKRRIYISSGLGLYSSSQKIIQSLKKKERKKEVFFKKNDVVIRLKK
jgi:hypothetical protein